MRPDSPNADKSSPEICAFRTLPAAKNGRDHPVARVRIPEKIALQKDARRCMVFHG